MTTLYKDDRSKPTTISQKNRQNSGELLTGASNNHQQVSREIDLKMKQN